MTAPISRCMAPFFALLAASGAHAQPPVPPAPDSGIRVDRPQAPPPPAGRSDDLLDGIAVDFSISDDDPEASVEVGNSFMVGPPRRNARGIPEYLNAHWNIRLTVPLAGDDDITSSSTLFGVLNGPKLTVNVGLFGFRVADLQAPHFREIMVQADERCRQTAEAVAA